MKSILSKNILNIMDVGASGATERNKFNFAIDNNISKIYKFDYGEDKKINNEIFFDKILWSEEKEMSFYISKNRVASSLFKVDLEKLKHFDNFESHKTIDTKKIKTSKASQIKELIDIDFAKIDVEGAELNILEGMEKNINNIIGLEVEVQFMERYINSPTFEKIDKFLKEKDFELYILNQESWLRKEHKSNSDSNHKLIWADAIYFIKLDKLINSDEKNIKNSVEKLIFFYVFYKLYDEAYFTINYLLEKKLITNLDEKRIKNFIDINIKSDLKIITKNFLNFVFACCVLSYTIFFKKHRFKGISYFKKIYRKFFYSIANLAKFDNQDKNITRDTRL